MTKTILIPVLASILILGTLGLSYDVFAADDNNGNNGCENANPNAKACEKNPNTEPLVQTVKITVTHTDTGQFFEGANFNDFLQKMKKNCYPKN